MTTQRQYNELAARLAKLETLLQNNDAYSPPGAVKLDDLDFGPEVDLSIPDITQFMNQTQPDVVWDPQFTSDQQMVLQDENYGFGPTDSAITDMLQRLSDLETFVAGGSNDTNQSGALNAGADVGDDGLNGSDSSGATSSTTQVSAIIYGLSGAATPALTDDLSFPSSGGTSGMASATGITTPAEGWYLIDASLQMAGAGFSSNPQVAIYKNAVLTSITATNYLYAGDSTIFPLFGLLFCAAGDFISIRAVSIAMTWVSSGCQLRVTIAPSV